MCLLIHHKILIIFHYLTHIHTQKEIRPHRGQALPPHRADRDYFVPSLFSFIKRPRRWSELTKAGRPAVSQRVINYPDSFGAMRARARALLSIKVEALGRGNFLRLLQAAIHESWLLCSLVSARFFLARSRKEIERYEERSHDNSRFNQHRSA